MNEPTGCPVGSFALREARRLRSAEARRAGSHGDDRPGRERRWRIGAERRLDPERAGAPDQQVAAGAGVVQELQRFRAAADGIDHGDGTREAVVADTDIVRSCGLSVTDAEGAAVEVVSVNKQT